MPRGAEPRVEPEVVQLDDHPVDVVVELLSTGLVVLAVLEGFLFGSGLEDFAQVHFRAAVGQPLQHFMLRRWKLDSVVPRDLIEERPNTSRFEPGRILAFHHAGTAVAWIDQGFFERRVEARKLGKRPVQLAAYLDLALAGPLELGRNGAELNHLLRDHVPLASIAPSHRAPQLTGGVKKRHRNPIDLWLDDDWKLVDFELFSPTAKPSRQLVRKRHRLAATVPPIR